MGVLTLTPRPARTERIRCLGDSYDGNSECIEMVQELMICL